MELIKCECTNCSHNQVVGEHNVFKDGKGIFAVCDKCGCNFSVEYNLPIIALSNMIKINNGMYYSGCSYDTISFTCKNHKSVATRIYRKCKKLCNKDVVL